MADPKVDRASVISYLETQYDFLEVERVKLRRSLERLDQAMLNILGTIEYLASDELPKAALDSEPSARKPADLKLSIFQGKKLSDVIVEVFKQEEQNHKLKIQELTQRIYATSNDDEVKACRSSLASALHRLDKDGVLMRISPGEYALDPRQYREDLL